VAVTGRGRPVPSEVVRRLRLALSVVGTVLTGAGVLILLFVAYQLWGTALYTSRQQGDLEDTFRARIAQAAPSPTTAPPGDSRPTTTRPPPPPPDGEAVAILSIPRIGMDEEFVVEGVSLGDLRKGPGHYPDTPLPGENGNAAIAGHRTTYGAPFNRLDELRPGDRIEVTTLRGSFTYLVEGSKIVRPEQVEVLDPTPDARLTLTTCHPKYSARQRLIVTAVLGEGQETVEAAPRPDSGDGGVSGGRREEALADAGLGNDASKVPVVLWGMLTGAVGAAWWWATRRRRHWTTYAAGVLPFLVVLFFFYAEVERLLPANF
jgi:sortase A